MKPGSAFPNLAPPHSGPQLRTRETVDSWVWLDATEGLGASCRWDAPQATRWIDVGLRLEDLGSRRFGLPRIIDLMSRTDPTGRACSDSFPWPTGGIWRCKQPRTLTGPRDVPWTWVGRGNIMTLQALHRSSGPPHGLMPDGGKG